MNQPFVHALADVHSTTIGRGTNIWQFVVIFADAEIGEYCNICSHCLIENDVVIGDRVTVKSGVQLWDGLRIGNDVFIGPNVSFINEKSDPESKKSVELILTVVGDGASIGTGAVISSGVLIGSNAVVAAGAIVNRTVPPNAIVEGSPAKIVGYVNSATYDVLIDLGAKEKLGGRASTVIGATLHRMPSVPDIRGNLTVGEFDRTIPFSAKRYFIVFGVPSVETRGEHAHRECHQFLVCVRGSCALVADDGVNREEFLLDQPDLGVHLAPMVWGIQYKYSPDAVLLVFASDYYDSSDYIRDYSDFKKMIRENALR